MAGRSSPFFLYARPCHAEVVAFLSPLAVQGRVAASTQNQALSALVFLYGSVIDADLAWLEGLVRAKRPERCLSS